MEMARNVCTVMQEVVAEPPVCTLGTEQAAFLKVATNSANSKPPFSLEKKREVALPTLRKRNPLGYQKMRVFKSSVFIPGFCSWVLIRHTSCLSFFGFQK